jgi:hypothetical protein
MTWKILIVEIPLRGTAVMQSFTNMVARERKERDCKKSMDLKIHVVLVMLVVRQSDILVQNVIIHYIN